MFTIGVHISELFTVQGFTGHRFASNQVVQGILLGKCCLDTLILLTYSCLRDLPEIVV